MKPQLLEDHIGQHLAESAKAGELQRAPSYGKPLAFGDGYDETPLELRMGFKILKDAGVVPPEVELMQQIDSLREAMQRTPDDAALRQRLCDLQQLLALRIERLRG